MFNLIHNMLTQHNSLIKHLTLLITRLLTLIALFLLSACGIAETCIDPDDFGFAKFNIPARYDSSQLLDTSTSTQVAPWLDSGLHVNGEPLTIVVKNWDVSMPNTAGAVSGWCPWYGSDGDIYATIALYFPKCIFINGQMCTTGDSANIANAPCYFNKGIGAYALIATPGQDPNLTTQSMQSPSGINFHLGTPQSNYTLYNIDYNGNLEAAGGRVFKYSNSNQQATQYNNAKLYFKILDKLYSDNSGQYQVYVKSGIGSYQKDPIQYLTSLITNNLFGSDNSGGVIKIIYEAITSNDGYINFVRSFLALYVAFFALSYLVGNINITNAELISAVLKIAIVSALITTSTSWSFFYNYLYTYFIGGTQELLTIIQQAGAIGPNSNSIIDIVLAPQTMAKLWSLLIVDWHGFIYIIVFLLVILFLVVAYFRASVIYLVAFAFTGMIIILGPIFIALMLFRFTRSLFENWLKQLVSYAIQPLLLFTGLAFISIIFQQEIYKMLGFGVCKTPILNLGDSSILGTDDGSTSIFFWWKQAPIKITSADLTNIPVPIAHYQSDGNYCRAYECFEERYPSLPFLDPVADSTLIANFANGQFVELSHLLLVVVSIYLLSKFNQFSVSLARILSDTSGNSVQIKNAASSIYNPIEYNVGHGIKSIGVTAATAAKRSIYSGLQNNRIGRGLIAAGRFASAAVGVVASIPTTIDEKYQNTRVNDLEERIIDQASRYGLTNSGLIGTLFKDNKVIKEAARKSGLDLEKVNVGAINEYRNYLQSALKEIDPNLKKADLEKAVKGLSKLSYTEALDRLSALKFGDKKNYGNLTDKEKNIIDQVIKRAGPGSLKKIAGEAIYAQEFVSAYVSTYRDLGVIGKRTVIGGPLRLIGAPARFISGTVNTLKTERNLAEQLRVNRGERIYAGYESFKSKLLDSVIGVQGRRIIEGNSGGAVWNEIDYNDKRLRTYSEVLADQERELKAERLKLTINRLTVDEDNDILSPEYLAKLEPSNKQKYQKYKTITDQKITSDVFEALTKADQPIYQGDQFLSTKATDKELTDQIDSIYKVRKEFIAQDRYIRRQEVYESSLESSLEEASTNYRALQNIYGDFDIYNTDKLRKDVQNEDHLDLIEKFTTARDKSDYTRQILEEIENRKESIANEFGSYVEQVNSYRQNAKLPVYRPTIGSSRLERKTYRTIADEVRGGEKE